MIPLHGKFDGYNHEDPTEKEQALSLNSHPLPPNNVLDFTACRVVELVFVALVVDPDNLRNSKDLPGEAHRSGRINNAVHQSEISEPAIHSHLSEEKHYVVRR